MAGALNPASQLLSRKRPLPPIEPREHVKRQAQYAKDIIVLDDDSEATTGGFDGRLAETKRITPYIQSNGSQSPSDAVWTNNRVSRNRWFSPPICQNTLDGVLSTPTRDAGSTFNNTTTPSRSDIRDYSQRRSSSFASSEIVSTLSTIKQIFQFKFSGEDGLGYALERLRTLPTANNQSPLAKHACTDNTLGAQAERKKDQEQAIRRIRSIREGRNRSLSVSPKSQNSAASNKHLFHKGMANHITAAISTNDAHTIGQNPPPRFTPASAVQNASNIGQTCWDDCQDHPHFRQHREARPHPHSNRGLRERPRFRPSRIATSLHGQSDDPAQKDDNAGSPSRFHELVSSLQAPALLSDEKKDKWLSIFRPRGDMSELHLPKWVFDLSPERQQIVIDHESAKSRQKDLKALREAILESARNASVGDFRENELNEIRRYIVAVLDKNLSGKQQRARIQNIRDNSRNRRNASGFPNDMNPSETQLNQALNTIISSQQFQQLQRECGDLDVTVNDLSAQRKADWERHRRNHNGKNGSDAVFCKQPENKITHPPVARVRSKRQQGRHVSKETKKEQIAKLQEKIADMKARERGSIPTPASSPECPDGMTSRDARDEVSSESEEEGGAEFLGIAKAKDQPIPSLEIVHESDQAESDTIETESQQKRFTASSETMLDRIESDTAHNYINQQAFQQQNANEKLLQENLRRQRIYQEHKSEEARAVESHVEGIGEEIDCEESDGIDGDLETSEQDNHDDRIVIRYVVNACFRGFKEWADGETYLIGHFHKLPTADQRLDEVIAQARQEYMNETSKERSPVSSLHQSYDSDRDCLRRLALKLGQNGDAECSVWVEEEQHDLSEEAYQLAKVRKFCQKKPLWYVIWEKVEYYQEVHATTPCANDSASADEATTRMSSCFRTHSATDTIGYKPPYIEEVAEHDVQLFQEPAVDLFIEYESVQHDNIQQSDTSEDVTNKTDELHLSDDGQSKASEVPGQAVPILSASSPGSRLQSPTFASAQLFLPPPVVTHTTHQDIKGYTTIALANRAALAKYLEWWYSTLSPEVKCDHAWLRNEEHFLEEDVRRHGHKFLWESQKQEVVLGEKVVAGKQCEKIVVFWTAVKELDIYGPANTGYGE